MTKPQLENGYTRIANEIMEALCRSRIPGEQRQCLDFIIRKTYGYNKKQDCISNSQFCEATGLKKQHVYRSIKGLIAKNIVTKKDYKPAQRYCFNKDYSTWKLEPKKVTVTKNGSAVTKNGYNSNQKRCPQKTKDNIQKTLCPDIFPVTQQMKSYSASKNYQKDLEDLTEGFLLYHKSKGNKLKCWYSAWQTWLRNDIKWHGTGEKAWK